MRVLFLLTVSALALVQQRPTARRRPLLSPPAAASGGEENAGEENATVYSATKKQFSEERYPYSVYDTTPPRKMVGVFPLSPTTGCGDILRLTKAGDADRTDAAYLIKKVSASYRFRDGRFHLLSKRADATEVNRALIEKRLARLLPRDP